MVVWCSETLYNPLQPPAPPFCAILILHPLVCKALRRPNDIILYNRESLPNKCKGDGGTGSRGAVRILGTSSVRVPSSLLIITNGAIAGVQGNPSDTEEY